MKNLFNNGYIFCNHTAQVYGERYVDGDTIEMCVDLKNYQLSYTLNDKDLGIAYNNLYKSRYKLAVALYYQYNCVTVMDTQYI